MIATARWADMTADGATNAADITAASDKVKEIPEALTKPRTMLIPGILDPFRNVNVTELQNTVDAQRVQHGERILSLRAAPFRRLFEPVRR